MLRFMQLFESNKGLYTIKKHCRFEISSDRLCDAIERLDMHPRKTKGNSFVQLDNSLMRHFLRGYFDGDGTISRCISSNKLHDVNLAISGYKKNLSKIINYLNSYNIFTNFFPDQRKISSDETDEFGALYATNKLTKYCFLKHMYSNSTIHLDRKYKLAMEFIKIIEDEESKIAHKNIVVYYNYAVQKVS